MGIEKVRLKRTLKAGKTVWLEGEILEAPLPNDILEEIRKGTGMVEVLEERKKPRVIVPEVLRPVFQDEIGNEPVSTTTSVKVRRVRRIPK